jgi:uncharacterized protein
VNHVFPEWPIPDTQYQRFYLGASGTLEVDAPTQRYPDSVTYRADIQASQMGNDDEELQFEYTFDKDTYIVGYSKATLFVVAEDHDDMEIFVQLRKADKDGNLLSQINIPPEALGMTASEVPNVNVLRYLGPPGIVRASHREVDQELSQLNHPVLAHRTLQKIKPGELLKLEIGLWPGAMAFSPGEKLVVKISGHEMRLAEFPALYGAFRTINIGKHTIYCGKSGHASEIVLPFVEL